MAAALAVAQAPPTVPTNPASDSNIADKHPPAPPKFNGDKGDGKVSFNAWLLHFLDWCALHSVPTSRRVAYAVQALEASAVEAWYPRKQQLELDGKEPYNWDTFRADMIGKYADVSPDLFVRSN